MSYTPYGFDEDNHADINRPIDPPALVAVLDTRWCETCFTDKHHECHGTMQGTADYWQRCEALEPLTRAA